MKVSFKFFTTFCAVAAMALGGLWAQSTKIDRVSKTQEPADGFEPVEFFSAMDSGDIKVKLRMEDSASGKFIIENASDKALSVQMPEAFAGVPLMFQGIGRGGGGGAGAGGLGGGAMGGMGGGMMGGQGAGGGFGGGMGGGGFGGGMGGGMGGGGFGGGAFNIPAGEIGRVKVNTVCLEYGKEDPAPFRAYKVIPIDQFTTNPNVIEACKMLARGEISQPVAQATAWHIANGLTWNQMLVLNRVELSNGYFERYFHPNHLLAAQQVTVEVQQRVDRAKSQATSQIVASPGERQESKSPENN